MKIAVLMGWISEERSVSLASGAQVARALREAGHEVLAVDTSRGVLGAEEEETLRASGIGEPPTAPLTGDILLTGDALTLFRGPLLAGIDVVFLTLHGGSGENGTVQTLLELARIPFVGSERLGCALAMDKDFSKRLFRDAGIPTPAWVTTWREEEGEARLREVAETLGLPLIVKPVSGGSTLGLTLVREESGLPQALSLALEYHPRVLFERYVQGREVTVGILGEEALPVGEIIPEHEIFDYACKYQPGLAQEIFPADLPAAVARRVQEAALGAHRALRLRDFSRVDFILDGEGTPWCLEANALPGLTGNSLIPKAARAAGIPFPELCHRIAVMAVARAGERSREGPGPGSAGPEQGGAGGV